jgi:hypothetical protein
MDEAKLEPPIIAHLFHLMARRNKEVNLESIPLTLDEALRAIDRLAQHGKSSPNRSS